MFRRLFSAALLLLLPLLAGLALVVGLAVHDPGARAVLLTTLVLFGLVGVGSSLVGAYYLAKLHAQPLHELVAATEQLERDIFSGVDPLGRGNRSTRDLEGAPLDLSTLVSDDEIGVLARQFTQMRSRLAERLTQLEGDREQLRAILSGMVEGVVALDADQRILFVNERALDLLRLPSPPPVGRRLWEVLRQRPLLDIVQKAVRGEVGTPVREEVNWDGLRVRNLLVHAACLTEENSPNGVPATPLKIKGTVLVLHDISDLRRLEGLRQEFVANVSHELKTPLQVITACVETLLDGAIDDVSHRHRFLEQLHNQAQRLHTLIVDLLSLARIEAGEQVFDCKAIPIPSTLALALERHRTRATARRQVLEAVAPENEDTNLTVWADEDAVQQILDNLLDNAVKYTPEEGRVWVSWKAEDEKVRIEVGDTGIGIPEADLPRIFERFYRVDKARSRQMGGTGLGLAIVKHMVQAMRGQLRVTSRVGQGTVFQVLLPRTKD